jgi:hypothetical protein
MIEEINAVKTAKNLLQGKTCFNCVLYTEKNESLSADVGQFISRCELTERETNKEQSCMFWVDSEDNMLEYIKRNGLTLEDMRKMWFKV